MSVLLAVLLNAAVQAVGLDGFADVASVKQYPVMGFEAQLGRDVA